MAEVSTAEEIVTRFPDPPTIEHRAQPRAFYRPATESVTRARLDIPYELADHSDLPHGLKPRRRRRGPAVARSPEVAGATHIPYLRNLTSRRRGMVA